MLRNDIESPRLLGLLFYLASETAGSLLKLPTAADDGILPRDNVIIFYFGVVPQFGILLTCPQSLAT